MFSKKVKRRLFNLYLSIPGTQYIFALIRMFVIPSYRWRRLLRFKGVFELSVDNLNFKLASYGNTIENELFWLGASGWEGRATSAWKKLSEQSAVIFDIGANTGLYSLIGAIANPSASVFAFEPLTEVMSRLKRNLELNKVKVNACQMALSNEDGHGKIFALYTISGTFDQATLNETKYQGPAVRYETVKKRRLSSFIEDNAIARVDLMKIDVETFEPQVLLGMGHYLQLYAPTVLLEILNENVATAVTMAIAGIDYQYYKIDEKKGYFLTENLIPDMNGNNFLLLNRSKHPLFQIPIN
jgi:FkbM family methyltransferase